MNYTKHEDQNKPVAIFDTTLRDGSQSEDVSFTLSDKLKIADKLNDIGIHYIEGGWPGSNPKDMEFFSSIQSKYSTYKSKITAFGSTRRNVNTCETDPNVQSLLEAACPAVCIFGKTWDFHVKEALGITLDENLEMIYDTVLYLKKHHDEVLYDAEHFFDGYKKNPEYALKTLKAAQDAGADFLVLCDTNGGTMPWEVEDIIRTLKKEFHSPLGIHTHNDSELAVANSLFAVREGATMVQGTVNGFGERCGNCNLISVIADLKFKMNRTSIPDEGLKKLTRLSNTVREIANLNEWKNQPYTGTSAFAHKGGIHVSAIRKAPATYEHIEPKLVGNHSRVLVSDLSGVSNIKQKIEEFGLSIDDNSLNMKEVVEQIKALENEGYTYEAADASLELIIMKARKLIPDFFTLRGYRVIDEKRNDDQDAFSEATVMIETPDGAIHHTADIGKGPVDALNNCLQKALCGYYPVLNDVKLNNYTVRILDGKQASAAKTRVLITSDDGENIWTTVGLSHDIIRASYLALTDAIAYKLYLELKNKTGEITQNLTAKI